MITFRNPVIETTLGWTWELQNPSHFVTKMSPLHVLIMRPFSSYSSGTKNYNFDLQDFLFVCLFVFFLNLRGIPFMICTCECKVSQFSSPILTSAPRQSQLNTSNKSTRYIIFAVNFVSVRRYASKWRQNSLERKLLYDFSELPTRAC